jgi:Peptidase family M28/PDZ domain
VSVRLLLFLIIVFTYTNHSSIADELKIVPPASGTEKSEPLKSIQAGDIKKHISFLASDALEGREAGSRGGYAAGAYIANYLKKMDQLKPAGQNDSFQYFDKNYRNLLFQIKGTDPTLSKEIILIGGHYDHVGYGNQFNSRGPIGQIHNGADDNASGVALLMELAEALQLTPYQGKRTIVLAFWDAEEKGLLGSRHWVAHPTQPLSQIKFVINIDMVGRMQKNPVKIIGTRSAFGLRKFMSKQTGTLPVKLEFDWVMDPNSDHFPFFKKKLPVAFFHTGKHIDYHRPSDDVEKVDFDGIEKQGQYIYQLLMSAVNAKLLPSFRQKSIQESHKKNAPVISVQKQSQSRLGIAWAYYPSLKREVKITKVYSGTPAEDAGLQIGDEITSFGGYSVKECEDFRQIVSTVRQNVTAEVKKAGSDEIMPVYLTLDGEPQRVGISWFTDTAEPESIILTHVATGTTADICGLKEGDRIYQLDHIPINKISSLQDYLQEIEGSIPVQFEHEGHVRNSILKLLPRQKIEEDTPPNPIIKPGL